MYLSILDIWVHPVTSVKADINPETFGRCTMVDGLFASATPSVKSQLCRMVSTLIFWTRFESEMSCGGGPRACGVRVWRMVEDGWGYGDHESSLCTFRSTQYIISSGRGFRSPSGGGDG